MLGVVEHVRSGGINGHCTGIGGGISLLLSDMELQGFKFIFRHDMYLFLLLYLSFGYENAPACQNCNRSHQNQSGCRKPALKSRLQRSTHSSIAEVLTQKSDKSSVHRTRSFQFMFFISIKYVNWMISQLSYYVNRNSIFF